ncbi:MAG: flagellar hook-basal body protein [Synergistaceae bacterium]|jgi:flagellar basal-body rod protein FlgG|nr:flagellar hook-basal body protein [Synergistaceae bacterium]
MFRGIYTGTSAMLVQEKMLDVVGNNLANVDTSGFRGRVAVNKSFPEVLMDRVERYTIVDEALNEELKDRKFSPYFRGRSPIGTISMTNVLSETTMSTERGPIQWTDNPTDVVLNGDGFFVVEDGNGNTFYTRSGHFQKNDQGDLVTHDGEFIQGDGGRVNLGEATRIAIGDSGQIYADGELVGALRVVEFETPTYLRHVGKSLLEETDESGGPQDVETPSIISGGLERSNVQVVLEMVRMIEANRAFEAAGRAVTIQDELSSRLFTSVGRPT